VLVETFTLERARPQPHEFPFWEVRAPPGGAAMKETVLAIIHPQSRGIAAMFFLENELQDFHITDTDEGASLYLLDEKIDRIFVDPMVFFSEDFPLLQTIKMLRPDIEVSLL
jgi:hypothetical protein